MKRKHYVLGLIFNSDKSQILLINKKRPDWQLGMWNCIGGKIDETDATPLDAMNRECLEETGMNLSGDDLPQSHCFGGTVISKGFEHCITLVCPGGTLYVYTNIVLLHDIPFEQIEDEELNVSLVDSLPRKLMHNLRWIIPFCLSSVQMPIMVHQDDLGIEIKMT